MINDDFLYISYDALCSLFALLKMKKISLDNFSVAPMAMVHPHIRTPKNWYNRFILGCWTFSLICLLTIISVYQAIVLRHAQNIIYYLVIFCQMLFSSCSAWFVVIRLYCCFLLIITACRFWFCAFHNTFNTFWWGASPFQLYQIKFHVTHC